MSPIELIRAGIVNANWTEVCSGFMGLTGEDLAPPTPQAQLPNASKLRNLLTEALHLTNETAPSAPTLGLNRPKAKVRRTKQLKQPATPTGEEAPERQTQSADPFEKFRIEPLQAKRTSEDGKVEVQCKVLDFSKNQIKNNFVDDGSLCVEDIHFDELVGVHSRQPQKPRPEAKLIKMTCSGCKKEFNVPPKVVQKVDNDPEAIWKCNKCSTNRR